MTPLYEAQMTGTEELYMELFRDDAHYADVYICDADQEDAPFWKEVARLWIAAPSLLSVLRDARDAIEHLPEDALGSASRTETLPSGEMGLMEWPIRDELLDKINREIAKVKGE